MRSFGSTATALLALVVAGSCAAADNTRTNGKPSATSPPAQHQPTGTLPPAASTPLDVTGLGKPTSTSPLVWHAPGETPVRVVALAEPVPQTPTGKPSATTPPALPWGAG